ncbi:serine hydrolase domain-containing protein [Aureisphaera sp.]
MQDVMEANNVLSGSLGVVYKGRLVHCRGYTNAMEGYPITKPTSIYRTASVTKFITAYAIRSMEMDGFNVNGLFQNYIPTENEENKALGYDKIKIIDVLNHKGGLSRSHGVSTTIAKDLKVAVPITLEQKRKWCRMRKMAKDKKVGMDYSYSNLGYTLLGQLIEEQTGKLYYSYVYERILKPLGLTRPHIGNPFGDYPEEVKYQPTKLSVVKSALNKNDNLVSQAYEGRNYYLTLSSGGWIFSAPDMAKVLASLHSNVQNPILSRPILSELLNNSGLSITTASNGVIKYTKGGSSSTTSTHIHHRNTDVSFVILLNKSIKEIRNIYNSLSALADNMQATDWPSHDLFPQYNIPSF